MIDGTPTKTKVHHKGGTKTRDALITLAVIAGLTVIVLLLGFHHVEPVDHPAETHTVAEVSHTIPAKTHKVYHPAKTKTTGGGCITANIGNYAGKCATARCADGTYTGANPYYHLTCNYHGGVAKIGSFYHPKKTVVIKKAWTETIVDRPAKKVVDSPAKTVVDKKAYTTPGYWEWYGNKL